MKINIQQVYIILVLSIFLSFVRYLFLNEDYSLIKKSKLESLDIDIANDEFNALKLMVENIASPTVININIAKSLFDNDLVTFIDARDVESFREKHILHAINIPYDLVEDINNDYDLSYSMDLKNDFYEKIVIEDNEPFYFGRINNHLFIADKTIDIINEPKYTAFLIYCSGEGCSLSEDLGFYMYDNLGFAKIFIYEGGMPEWNNYGYPIISPESNLPFEY